MTLKIEGHPAGETAILRLVGRIGSEHLQLLEEQIESVARPLVLDLMDVMLVDRAAVRFLRTSEERGVTLQNCPPYIREWILRDGQIGDDAE
jgi:anti-anti-sigma regulatory factor